MKHSSVLKPEMNQKMRMKKEMNRQQNPRKIRLVEWKEIGIVFELH